MIKAAIIMNTSNQSLLQLLKEKANILNQKCQQFQVEIKNVMNKMMESEMKNENKLKFQNKINELFDDYSLSINRLEIEYLIKCEKYLKDEIKDEIDNQSSKSSKSSTSYKTYKCQQCNISYTASSSLRRHNRKIHQNEAEYSIETAGTTCNDSDFSDCNEEYNDNSNSIKKMNAIKPYLCSECNKPFKMQKYLASHIRDVHNGYPYRCKLNRCHQKFKYKTELRVHQISIHTANTNNCNTDKDIKLDDNDDNDDSDIDVEIEDTSTNTPDGIENNQYCNLCNKDFVTSIRLKEHQLQRHSNKRPYECSQCDKAFKLQRFLFAHIRDTHGGYPWHCTFTGCNEKFKYHTELAQHKNSEHKKNELSIPATITTTKKRKLIETELNEEIDSNSNNNRLECDICFKLFKNVTYLKEHKVRLHSDDVSFICNYNDCNKSFKVKKTYYYHIRNDHNGYPWECTQCHQKFKYQIDLIKHQNSVHALNNDTNPRKKRKLNENENELFINNNNNNASQQIEKERNETHHNDPNNNDNSIKSTPFSSQQRRNKRRLYISDTDSDTDSDDDDDNNNNNMNTLRESNQEMVDSDNQEMVDLDDMNTNNEEKQFQCNICFKSFENESGLAGHLSHCKYGDNNKRCQCEQCGRTFKLKRYLNQHIKTQHNKGPYKCDECGDKFKNKNIMIQHKKWIHDQSIVSISSTPSNNTSNTSQNKSPNKVFECDICHKQLSSLKSLNEHKSLKHETNSKQNNMNINDMNTSNISKQKLNESEKEELKLLHNIPDLEEPEDDDDDDDMNNIQINNNSYDKPLIVTRTKSLFNRRL